jgi:hypothetical protein
MFRNCNCSNGDGVAEGDCAVMAGATAVRQRTTNARNLDRDIGPS